jgi:hypothetical protein
MRQPMTYAMRRKPLSVPRRPAGDTSDRYSGTICDEAPTRGLHSSTSQLNVSTVCG